MKRILSVLLAFVLLGGLAVTPVMAWDSHNFKYVINKDVIYDKELNNSTGEAQSIKSGQTVRGTLTVPGSWKGISNGTTVMDDFCDMDYFEFTLNERSDILVAAFPESYCNQDYMVITVSDRNDTTISKSFSNGNDSPDQVVAMITDTLDAGTYYITFFCGVDDTKYNGASYIGYFEAIPAENSNVGSGSLADKFNDCSEINPKYIEAVNYAVSKNIIAGYVDNTFKPQVKLNRGAASKFIAYLCLGSDVASKLSVSTAPFPDVPTDNTFAGYIGYCAYAGIINGYSDGKYKITAPLSAAAFGKMLLTAIQYPTETSGYTGTGWKENVYSDGAEVGIFKGNMDFGLDDVLTREQAAFMLFNAMMWVDKHGDHFQPIMPPSELTNPVTPTIPQYPTGITFTASSLTIKQNSGGSVNVSITPSNAVNKNITWSSSNRSVATVDSAGYVWGVSAGTATITATTSNGLAASFIVTVSSNTTSGKASIEDYVAPTVQTYSGEFRKMPVVEHNSVGGVKVKWEAQYLGSQNVNYYTVYFTMCDKFGKEVKDEITGRSQVSTRVVGPVRPGEKFLIYNLIGYNSICDVVKITKIKLEFADGSIVEGNYSFTIKGFNPSHDGI